jgi:MFS family permease
MNTNNGKVECDTANSHEGVRTRDDTISNDEAISASQKLWRFWAVFPGLCFCSFLTALDASVVFNALPTIVNDLGSGDTYIWIVNAYTLAMTALQPLYGQVANIFGRRVSLIAAIGMFLVGSLVCALSKSTVMLILGRAVQGMGGGGLSILPGMIICDLVPLRERQKYTAIIYGTFAIGTFIGPVLGGTLAETIGWRWIFYLVLIIGVAALGLVILFLRLKHGREGTFGSQVRRIDFLGNAVLTTAIASMLIALSWADARYPWSSWRCIVPLLCGLFGIGIFVYLQSSPRVCPNPTVPLHLFKKKTPLLAFAMTFLHGLLLYWGSLCIPLYFQAVRLDTPKQSGVNFLPMVMAMIPAGILGGFTIARFGRYKPSQIGGFALMLVAQGCFSLLRDETGTAQWAVFQIIAAFGGGLVLTALLPAIQADLSEDDTASSTAMWGFFQSLGFVWGAAVPSAVCKCNKGWTWVSLIVVVNSHAASLLEGINDDALFSALGGGRAYDRASREFLVSLPKVTQKKAIWIFQESLGFTWRISLAFGGLGLLLACLIPEVRLRTELGSKYGLEDAKVAEDG